jgi:hypothetical protein
MPQQPSQQLYRSVYQTLLELWGAQTSYRKCGMTSVAKRFNAV